MTDDQSADGTNRVVIVQCTNAKRDGKHSARLLYDESDYFRKQRTYAEAVADYQEKAAGGREMSNWNDRSGVAVTGDYATLESFA